MPHTALPILFLPCLKNSISNISHTEILLKNDVIVRSKSELSTPSAEFFQSEH